MPDNDPVASDSPTVPAEPEKDAYVAKTAIFLNGVRAYNEGDRVSANAVKKNDLQKLVKKA